MLLGNIIQADFTPSGQARNEHSLNRWGFKISIRPVYGLKQSSYKELLSEERHQQLVEKFGSEDQVISWVNSIKLLETLINDTIQSLISPDELRTNAEKSCINQLKCTLLKDGSVGFNIEDYLIKCPEKNIYELKQPLQKKDATFLQSFGNNQMFKLKEQPRYWLLKRELMQSNYSYFPKCNDDSLKGLVISDEQLWETVINCNKLICNFVKQIQQREGEFYNLGKELISQFVDSFAYKVEKQRPLFKQQQMIWEQMEQLIILVILYHSGLMHAELSEISSYLLQNISIFQEVRNEMIAYLILTIQNEKEWQQNLEILSTNLEQIQNEKKELSIKKAEVSNQKQNEQKQQKDKAQPQPSIIQPNPLQDGGHFVKQGNQLKFVSSKNKSKKKAKAKATIKAQPQDQQEKQVIQQKEKEQEKQPEIKEKEIKQNKEDKQKEQSQEQQDQEGQQITIDSETEAKLKQLIKDRLEGNPQMVQGLCKLRNLTFSSDDLSVSLNNVFNDMLSVLKNKTLLQQTFINPYQHQSQIVVRKALFLLTLNSGGVQKPSSIVPQQCKDEISILLKPPGMQRSVSHQLDERHVDSQRLLKFRAWLETYQRWKKIHSADRISDDITVNQAITQFLQTDINEAHLLEVMRIHDIRLARRVVGLQALSLMGLPQAPFVHSRKVELSGGKELLRIEIHKRQEEAMKKIQTYAQEARTLMRSSSKLDLSVFDWLKKVHMCLCEVTGAEATPIFIKNALEIALLCTVFVTLEQAFESVAKLSHHIVYAIKQILYEVRDNGNLLLRELLHMAKLELGISDNKINARLLVKLQDWMGINRMLFLLQHIYDVVLLNEVKSDLLNELAEFLLFVVYHCQSLSVVRVCCRSLKIISSKINFEQIKMALDYNYEWWTVEAPNVINPENLKKMPPIQKETKMLAFSKYEDQQLINPSPLMLLMEKLGRIILKEEDQNSLGNQLTKELVNIQNIYLKKRSDQRKYKVMVHLCQEEEVSILLKVLWWWEELYPQIQPKLPKSIEEFKDREKKREEVVPSAESQIPAKQQYKILERVLLTHPDIYDEDEPLPLGWGFNYSNLFGDLKVLPPDNRKQASGRVKKQIKKYWKPLNFLELERRFEEACKQPLPEDQDKEKQLKIRNFISRMYMHIRELKHFVSSLTVYGYVCFNDTYSWQKAQELAALTHLALQNKLADIPIPEMSEEIKKKLDPNPYIQLGIIKEAAQSQPVQGKQKQQQEQKPQPIPPQATNGKTNILVGIAEMNVFIPYEFRMEYVTLMQCNNTNVNFYSEINRTQSFSHLMFNGSISAQVVSNIISLLNVLLQQNNFVQTQIKEVLGKVFNETQVYEPKNVLILQFAKFYSNLSVVSQQVYLAFSVPGCAVYLRKLQHEQEKLYIIQGGANSGQKQCLLLSENDDKLNLQSVRLDEVEIYEDLFYDLNEYFGNMRIPLMKSILKLYEGNSSLFLSIQQVMKHKQQFHDMAILRNLLTICASLDWKDFVPNKSSTELIHQIILSLIDFSKRYPNCSQQQDANFASSWERFVDSFLASPLFTFPSKIASQPSLTPFIKELQKSQSQADINEPSNEENYVLPASTYMSALPESTTIATEQRLVSYWEKNILPKIHDYVKGSLRGYEIEDFFEQMRQPLRKGDQAKALEIAYIVCDQRLPSGVVVPDANHDWSTLSIEEIQTGQFVLARISDKVTDSNQEVYFY